jgi:hypothetical protein
MRKPKKEGDNMVATKKFTVKPMGGTTKTVNLPANSTIRTILAAAGIDAEEGLKYIANGVTVSLDSKMGSHKELIVIPTVKMGI